MQIKGTYNAAWRPGNVILNWWSDLGGIIIPSEILSHLENMPTRYFSNKEDGVTIDSTSKSESRIQHWYSHLFICAAMGVGVYKEVQLACQSERHKHYHLGDLADGTHAHTIDYGDRPYCLDLERAHNGLRVVYVLLLCASEWYFTVNWYQRLISHLVEVPNGDGKNRKNYFLEGRIWWECPAL